MITILNLFYKMFILQNEHKEEKIASLLLIII